MTFSLHSNKCCDTGGGAGKGGGGAFVGRGARSGNDLRMHWPALTNSGGFVWIAVPCDIYDCPVWRFYSHNWAEDAIFSSNNGGVPLTHRIEKNKTVALKKQTKQT